LRETGYGFSIIKMRIDHGFQTRYAVEAYSASRELWDTPIFECDSFVALPTVGALLEGWLLVVPRIQTLSFANLSISQFAGLEAFLADIIPTIQSSYGPVSVFEHGPAKLASCVGCGVDYAHLHIVPAPCDLLAGARQVAPDINWTKARSITELRRYSGREEGYWFIQQTYGLNDCHVGTCANGKPVSQLFRRVIANHLGKPLAFDWKNASGESMIASTVEKLTKHIIMA